MFQYDLQIVDVSQKVDSLKINVCSR